MKKLITPLAVILTLILILLLGTIIIWVMRERKVDTVKEWSEIGIKALTAKQYDEAITEFKKAIKINPNYADAHNYLGLAYSKKGMLDKAISEYKKAIKIKPDYALAHLNLGVVYDNKGMVDEAISEYKIAISINPDFAEYKIAISINPDFAFAPYALGLAFGKKDMIDEKISEYKKAIKINPNDALAHFNLGATYVNNKMESVGAEYLYKAGLLYLKQGNREEALNIYEALKRFITSEELEKALFKQLYPDIK
jgi:tetratricopeptide (TPR) repeat protein